MGQPLQSLQFLKPVTVLIRVSVGLFLLLLLSSFAKPLGTQQPPRPNSQSETQDTIKINVDLVVLHASVQDQDRLPVSGLNKQDFQIYEDGVLQQIESFSHGDIPVTVGLVIDNSGSMRPKRTEVIAAALAFARASNSNDQMFVVNFNERVFLAFRQVLLLQTARLNWKLGCLDLRRME